MGHWEGNLWVADWEKNMLPQATIYPVGVATPMNYNLAILQALKEISDVLKELNQTLKELKENLPKK